MAEEINDFICILSCDALYLTSLKGETAKVAKRLKCYIKRQKSAADDAAYFDADFRFHKAFFDYCGNSFLKETYKRYNLLRFLLIRYAIRTKENRMEAIKQHEAILSAYASEDYKTADNLLRNHYLRGLRLIHEVHET